MTEHRVCGLPGCEEPLGEPEKGGSPPKFCSAEHRRAARRLRQEQRAKEEAESSTPAAGAAAGAGAAGGQPDAPYTPDAARDGQPTDLPSFPDLPPYPGTEQYTDDFRGLPDYDTIEEMTSPPVVAELPEPTEMPRPRGHGRAFGELEEEEEEDQKKLLFGGTKATKKRMSIVAGSVMALVAGVIVVDQTTGGQPSGTPMAAPNPLIKPVQQPVDPNQWVSDAQVSLAAVNAQILQLNELKKKRDSIPEAARRNLPPELFDDKNLDERLQALLHYKAMLESALSTLDQRKLTLQQLPSLQNQLATVDGSLANVKPEDNSPLAVSLRSQREYLRKQLDAAQQQAVETDNLMKQAMSAGLPTAEGARDIAALSETFDNVIESIAGNQDDEERGGPGRGHGHGWGVTQTGDESRGRQHERDDVSISGPPGHWRHGGGGPVEYEVPSEDDYTLVDAGPGNGNGNGNGNGHAQQVADQEPAPRADLVQGPEMPQDPAALLEQSRQTIANGYGQAAKAIEAKFADAGKHAGDAIRSLGVTNQQQLDKIVKDAASGHITGDLNNQNGNDQNGSDDNDSDQNGSDQNGSGQSGDQGQQGNQGNGKNGNDTKPGSDDKGGKPGADKPGKDNAGSGSKENCYAIMIYPPVEPNCDNHGSPGDQKPTGKPKPTQPKLTPQQASALNNAGKDLKEAAGELKDATKQLEKAGYGKQAKEINGLATSMQNGGQKIQTVAAQQSKPQNKQTAKPQQPKQQAKGQQPKQQQPQVQQASAPKGKTSTQPASKPPKKTEPKKTDTKKTDTKKKPVAAA